jgi:hypothetical protein
MNPLFPSHLGLLPVLMDFAASLSFGSDPSTTAALRSFAILLLVLFLAAIPCFCFGIFAGWFQWSFLANRTIRSLKDQNAALRNDLKGPGLFTPNVG